MTPKQQIQALLSQLPDDASFAEIQDHLNGYGGRRASRAEVSSVPRPREKRNGAEAFAYWQEIVSI